MSKLTVILLTAVLVSGVIFAGPAEVKAVVEQRPTSVTVAAPLSVSSSLHPRTLDSPPFPGVPDTVIFSLLADRAQRLGWMQLTDYPRQIHRIAHTGHGTPLSISGGGEIMPQGKPPKIATPGSSSGSLSSLSPPGFTLRL